MKKIICIAIALSAAITAGLSQNEVDALRYSQVNHGGTARFVSMGGAFGALGGDPSVLSFNPAGLGVYRKSEFTFTPTFSLNKTSADYLNELSVDYKYNFNFNNFALVGAYDSGREEGWISTNIGFSYTKLADFNRYILIEGQNFNSSVSDYFAAIASGKTSSTMNSFNEWLAWETYMIDPDPNSTIGNEYISTLTDRGEIQTMNISTGGNVGEYAFSLGANYDHTLYIGGTIGIQSVHYEQNSNLMETDPDTLLGSFIGLEYKQHLETRGAGYNFKFGIIYRPVDWLRIGGAVHSPTFFGLNDDYGSSMRSSFDDTLHGDGAWVDSPVGDYNYKLVTPPKAIGSLAIIIKKSAIISVDYEFIDYSLARLRADDYPFRTENNNIQNYYTYANNIRAGIEYRVGQFSIRGGYALYGSPYNSAEIDNDGSMQLFSGGLGIRDKDFYFDIAYVYALTNEDYYLYSPGVVQVDPAKLESTSGRLMATIGIKF